MLGTLIDWMERLMFGASAQERVDLMIRLVEQRADARLLAALERLIREDATDGGDEREAEESSSDGANESRALPS